MDPGVLARKQLTELKGIASHLEMRGYQRLKKAELIEAIVAASKSAGAGGAPAGEHTSAAEGEPNGAVTVAQRPVGRVPRPRQAEPQLELDATPPGAHPARADGAQADGAQAEAASPGTAQGSAPEAAEDGTRTRVRTRSRERSTPLDDTPAESAQRNGDGAAGEQLAETGAAESGPAVAAAVTPDAGADASRNRQAAGTDGNGSRNGAAGAGPAPAEVPAGVPADGEAARRPDRDRPERGRAEQAREAAPRPDDDGDGEDSGSRRRRSRRERRRNKAGGPAGQPQGHSQGQSQGQNQQGRAYRDDDTAAEPGEVRSGVLDILPEGYGFLRTSGYLPGDKDVYVSQSQVRKHSLRRGDVIEGPVRQQRSNEKVPALHSVQLVNGTAPDGQGNLPHRPEFKDMTPLFPDERLRLETPDGPISMRIVDLISPIGKGQRALVVSPPKAGKTTILKELGQAVAYNSPECHLMVVLVDERPEEVTDMQRSVPGEIIASTFDRPADDHTQIAELAIERAKRLVELGQDVVVLLDSITRLSRAYNLAAPASGRIMSGGVDSTALYPPKRFFGAARNIEGGGSLTIVATALIDTGSKMDEVIFEEFKGTGNCELRLDRRLEQKRVFPAIDIEASSTRKEELLLDREEMAVIWKLRRVLHALDGPASLELLIDKMKQTRSNNQFLVQIQKSNLST